MYSGGSRRQPKLGHERKGVRIHPNALHLPVLQLIDGRTPQLDSVAGRWQRGAPGQREGARVRPIPGEFEDDALAVLNPTAQDAVSRWETPDELPDTAP
jgi:hypothetical protein